MTKAERFILERVVVEARAYMQRCDATCTRFARMTYINGPGNHIAVCCDHWQEHKDAGLVFNTSAHPQADLVEAIEAYESLQGSPT